MLARPSIREFVVVQLKRLALFPVALTLTALFSLYAPTEAQASTTVGLQQGGDINRIAKVLLDHTNSAFTALNYRDASASDRLGGSSHLVTVRRQLGGWWLYSGKSLNDISDSERQLIVREYWPDPPCTSCIRSGASSKSLYIKSGYVYTDAVRAAVARESGAGRPFAPAACTGSNRRVNVVTGDSWGYDEYVDSCRAQQMLRNRGFGDAACSRVLELSGAVGAVAFLKTAVATRGFSVVAAVFGGLCWAVASYEGNAIQAAIDQSSNGGIIIKVRKMGYTSYPSGHYLTNTKYAGQ